MPRQDISPLTPNLVDTMVKANDTEGWYADPYDPERAFTKVLWYSAETGQIALLYNWKKGLVAPAHKHTGASHTYIIKGKLSVRGATMETGDYIYEPNGVVHGATTALEDTLYLFIMDGVLVFFDDENFPDSFPAYMGWEEIVRQSRDAGVPV